MVFAQLSSLLLPLVVAGLIPALLLRSSHSSLMPASAALGVVGGALVLVGVATMAWTIGLFARVGKGSLAPWAPPRKFVVVGPYAHVRNPMIGGALCILAGEAVFFASARVAIWAAACFAINHVYFMLSEEPGLVRRFGSEYVAYKANVPRWIPRCGPARPPASRTQ
jgi:protein-S-isoprenylcysteine O-methyltransferase Ste14